MSKEELPDYRLPNESLLEYSKRITPEQARKQGLTVDSKDMFAFLDEVLKKDK